MGENNTPTALKGCGVKKQVQGNSVPRHWIPSVYQQQLPMGQKLSLMTIKGTKLQNMKKKISKNIQIKPP